jgi:hypothetical protein
MEGVIDYQKEFGAGTRPIKCSKLAPAARGLQVSELAKWRLT